MLNSTAPGGLTEEPPNFHSKPALELPSWGEPVLVALILLWACFYSRRRYVSLFKRNVDERLLLDSPTPTITSTSHEEYESESFLKDEERDEDEYTPVSTGYPRKNRSCLGTAITTPNTSRFKQHFHSRILYKFPFLMEMFYWVLTYAVYQISRMTAQNMATKDIWDIAQANGLKVLWVEQFSFLRFLFPVEELEVQQWFMTKHETALTVLNRVYALIHIPGSIFFLGWYYYSAPSHAQFAVMRRTTTLMNWGAFAIFTVYPCMPPRLLPPEYGFIDTVRRGSAQSVFMKGKYVNSLAAMPSMHFGYSFIVGMTLLYHSGVFTSRKRMMENGRFWSYFYVLLGVAYPLTILTTIVATANHYWLDPCVGTLVAIIAFFGNRLLNIFVPLEDYLFWTLRMEKPAPNCGPQGRR